MAGWTGCAGSTANAQASAQVEGFHFCQPAPKTSTMVDYQGNWRDIFQNWEVLATREPAYLGSMIATILGAMTHDGYNPYRISRKGIDWEVPEPSNSWSHIGFWGDHIYLLRLLEAAQAHDPSSAVRQPALYGRPEQIPALP